MPGKKGKRGFFIDTEWWALPELTGRGNIIRALAMIILGDLYYWSSPNAQGNHKYHGEKLQKSYGYYAKLIGVHKDTIIKCFDYLEKCGIIKRHFHHIITQKNHKHLSNVLYLDFNFGTLKTLLLQAKSEGGITVTGGDPSPSQAVLPSPSQAVTYTESKNIDFKLKDNEYTDVANAKNTFAENLNPISSSYGKEVEGQNPPSPLFSDGDYGELQGLNYQDIAKGQIMIKTTTKLKKPLSVGKGKGAGNAQEALETIKSDLVGGYTSKVGKIAVKDVIEAWYKLIPMHFDVGFMGKPTGKQRGQFRLLWKLAGNETVNVMKWAFPHWSILTAKVRLAYGLQVSPTVPTIGWMLTYGAMVVDVYRKAVEHEIQSAAEEKQAGLNLAKKEKAMAAPNKKETQPLKPVSKTGVDLPPMSEEAFFKLMGWSEKPNSGKLNHGKKS